MAHHCNQDAEAEPLLDLGNPHALFVALDCGEWCSLQTSEVDENASIRSTRGDRVRYRAAAHLLVVVHGDDPHARLVAKLDVFIAVTGAP